MAWKATCVGCTFLAALAIAVGSQATTIDFESPIVTAPEGYELVDPLVLEGVSFEVLGIGPVLFREDSVTGCQDTENQRLGGQLIFSPAGAYITIRANFPVSAVEPIHGVSVDVGSTGFETGMTLELLLYDANDVVLAESRSVPTPVDCWLRTRASLSATSTMPVAYAVISAYRDGVGDCLSKVPWCAYRPVWIDDLTFGSTIVAVEQATWSGLKGRFR